MYLKDDRLVITIENTVFTSHMTSNPQFNLDPIAIVGWDDGVGVKRSEVSRPNSWGDFAEKTLFGPRRVTLTGTAIARNSDELHGMRDTFTGLLNTGTYKEISLQNSRDKRFLKVSLEDSPSWVQKLDNVAVWKLDLYAPDPRLYGEVNRVQITPEEPFGGLDVSDSVPIAYPLDFGFVEEAIVIKNNGNTDSWPIFEVVGNYDQGFTITDGRNRSVIYNGVVTLEAPVRIDMAAGTATQNGIDKTMNVSRRDWFPIAKNTSMVPTFQPKNTAVGSGWCDIIYRDAWI